MADVALQNGASKVAFQMLASKMVDVHDGISDSSGCPATKAHATHARTEFLDVPEAGPVDDAGLDVVGVAGGPHVERVSLDHLKQVQRVVLVQRQEQIHDEDLLIRADHHAEGGLVRVPDRASHASKKPQGLMHPAMTIHG